MTITKTHAYAVILFSACLVAVILLPTLRPVEGCIRYEVWPRSLLALMATADALIAVSYGWIPWTLYKVWRKRGDVPVSWTLVAFAAFIAFCGLGHAVAILTAFKPLYWLAVEVQVATAIVSLVTAYLLQTRVGPILMTLRTYEEVVKSEAEARTESEELKSLRAQLEEAKAKAEAKQATAEKSEQAARSEVLDLERALRELREAHGTIAAQRRAISELEAVVVELWEGVLYVPIVGPLDSRRAQELQERVLRDVQTREADTVIIDLAGVSIVDTAVASWILKLNATVSLLGSRCHLTSIGPEVASSIVSLGVDLTTMETTRSPRAALSKILKR